MNKPIEEYLTPSDDLQNQLLKLATKILAREPLTAAEVALIERAKAIRNQINKNTEQ